MSRLDHLPEIPENTLGQIQALGLPQEIEGFEGMQKRWEECLSGLRSENPKDPEVQENLRQLLSELIESGEVPQAAVTLQVSRILRGDRGYDPNLTPGTDFNKFIQQIEVPEGKLVVVDHFLTRHAEIVEWCEKQEIPLDQLRFRVNEKVWAAQREGLSGNRAEKVNSLFSRLNENNFLIGSQSSALDIPVDGKIGALLSPRSLAFAHHLVGDSSDKTRQNYLTLADQLAAQTAVGGELILPTAFAKEGESPLEVGMRKGVAIIGSAYTKEVQQSFVDRMISHGFEIIDESTGAPISNYDHDKEIGFLHLRKAA